MKLQELGDGVPGRRSRLVHTAYTTLPMSTSGAALLGSLLWRIPHACPLELRLLVMQQLMTHCCGSFQVPGRERCACW